MKDNLACLHDEIQRAKEAVEKSKPSSDRRVLAQHELKYLMLRQLQAENRQDRRKGSLAR